MAFPKRAVAPHVSHQANGSKSASLGESNGRLRRRGGLQGNGPHAQPKASKNRQTVTTSTETAMRANELAGSGIQHIAPPPGLTLTKERHDMEQTVTPQELVDNLRLRPMPQALAADERAERFKGAVLSCVESLYRDRIAPRLQEVQRRLRSSGWNSADVQAILLICAREPDRYELGISAAGDSSRIYLRNRPRWFKGWIDPDAPSNNYPQATWATFRRLCEQLLSCNRIEPASSSGCARSILAQQLYAANNAVMQGQRLDLTLGEMRHMVELALGHCAVLGYDSLNGGKLVLLPEVPREEATRPELQHHQNAWFLAPPPGSVPPAAKGAPGLDEGHTCGKKNAMPPVEEHPIVAMWRRRHLPDGLCWPATDEPVPARQAVLYDSVANCYRDRIEPELREILRRLRNAGWSSHEVQGVLTLCARDLDKYRIELPASSKPLTIWLRTTPAWFRGWLDAKSAPSCRTKPPQQPCSSNSTYPAEVWEALLQALQGDAASSNTPESSLDGTINGAAWELHQLAMPQLQHLSLGELREVVKCAVGLQWLVYAGHRLRLTESALADLVPMRPSTEPTDHRIYAQI